MPSYQEQEWERLSIKRKRSVASLAASAIEPPVHFYALRVPDHQLKAIDNKAVRKFYERQNRIIDKYVEVDNIIKQLGGGGGCPETFDSSSCTYQNSVVSDEETPLIVKTSESCCSSSPSWIVHLAINLSFVANIILFLTKAFLAFFTGSIAILASAFESFLDILSNAIIFFTIRVIRQKNIYDYPVGKSRMEPLGIIVFAAVITTSFSQVLISSVEQLAEENRKVEHVDLSPLALGLLAANIIVKGVLWFWCLTVKGSSSVQALAQDHENDVVFNIASTIFPLFAVWAKIPWLDPVGAILLSLYIIYEWVIVLLENIRRLTGQTANLDDLKQLVYMAYRFSSKIDSIDTVRAYYVGDRLLVEVHIVLPPNAALRECHDLGEALQVKIFYCAFKFIIY
ncbi:cation efflux family-domain-containing protein [Helicostylum pulchrum]|nr:cation efflux family-domain-containing protein [Helicostylum pulchrum]